MYFDKKHGDNNYHVLACMDGYDMDKKPSEQEDEYDVWVRNEDLLELIVEYYNGTTIRMR